MTYNVFGRMLNLAQSIYKRAYRCWTDWTASSDQERRPKVIQTCWTDQPAGNTVDCLDQSRSHSTCTPHAIGQSVITTNTQYTRWPLSIPHQNPQLFQTAQAISMNDIALMMKIQIHHF